MEVGDYAQALAAAQRLVPNLRDIRTQELQQQGQVLQNQGMAQEQALATRKVNFEDQQRAAYQRDLAALGARPTPKGVYELALKHPDQKGLIEAAKGLDQEKRAVMIKHLGPIHSALQGGHTDVAIANFDRIIKADRDSGFKPDEDDVHIRDMLASGDKNQIDTAKGMVFSAMTAANPDTAAAVIARRDAGYNLGRNHYDADNDLVASAPEYHVMGPGKQLVQTGGLGGVEQQPGTGVGPSPDAQPEPAGVQRKNGWTPRERDGGDNPSPVVDAKLGNISQRLSHDIDKPLSKAQIGPLAEAIAATEGGPGSLADRNNNPTNIRDGAFAKSQSGYAGPGDGGYARFKSRAAGLLAAKGLLSRYYARGQRTIRDIIEGKPLTSGGTTPPAGGRVSVSGGARVVADGGPVPSYRMLTPAEVARQPGLDPSRPYQVSPTGRITPVGGVARGGGGKASGKSGGGGPPRTVTSVIAPILQKVAAGQTLTPGETEALRYYRAKGGKGGAAPLTGGGGKPPPKVGTVMDGHRFIGGDPGKQSNWVTVK